MFFISVLPISFPFAPRRHNLINHRCANFIYQNVKKRVRVEKPKVDESLLLKASLSDYAMLKVLVIVCGTDGDKRHSNGSRWLELRHDFSPCLLNNI